MAKINNKVIGNNIRLARIEKGIEQSDFARMLGISRSSIVNIEKGRQSCSTDYLIEICRITGFSPDTILGLKQGEKLPELLPFKLPYSIHKKLDKIPESYITAFLLFYKKTKQI